MRGPSHSTLSDAAPITRSSLAKLTGDDNDLLSESPVFAQADGIGGNPPANRPVSEAIAPRNNVMAEAPEDPLDEHLVNEINDYLTGIMEDGSVLIDMA